MKQKLEKHRVTLHPLFEKISKLLKKNRETDSSKSPRRKDNIPNDPGVLTSNIIPPPRNSSQKPNMYRDDSLTFQFTTENFHFKSQMTSLYMVSRPFELQPNPNRYKDHYISNASKHLASNYYWTSNIQNIFTLQMKFLCIWFTYWWFGSQFSIWEQKRVYHETNKRFWDNLPPNFTKISCFKTASLLSIFNSFNIQSETFINKLLAQKFWSSETPLFI